MAYRKRRRRGTWFPTLPFGIGPEGQLPTVPDVRQYVIPGGVSSNVDAIPVVPDQTPDDSAQGYTLRDQVEGQAYILQRIVGKIQWCCRQEEGLFTDIWPMIVCCTAFAVLPVNNDSEFQGLPDLSSTEFDPLRAENNDKPYIWRRTWVLHNNAAYSGGDPQQFWQGPSSNAFFASMHDGPHIDTKSKRRVGRDQRLFQINSVLPVATSGNTSVSFGADARCVSDLRVFGTLVKQRNTGTLT